MFSGGEILRRVEEAEVGPAEEGQEISRGCDGETSGGNDRTRLQGHMVRENGLSENQFSSRKGRSTVDAIQAVVDIATKARRTKTKGILRVDQH